VNSIIMLHALTAQALLRKRVGDAALQREKRSFKRAPALISFRLRLAMNAVFAICRSRIDTKS